MKFASVFALALAGASLGLAQNRVSYVSGTGLATNPCTSSAPCDTFQTALAKTMNGGIIQALTPGIYSDQSAVNPLPLQISQNVTIDGRGMAVINMGTVFDPPGIQIDGLSDVTIRNLALIGPGIGILVHSGSVHIENVQMNGGCGLVLDSSGVAIRATAKSLTIKNAKSNAISVNYANLSIQDSVIVGAGARGFDVLGTSVVTIEHCEISNNDTGLVVGNGFNAAPVARISNSVITGNNIGFSVGGQGQIISLRTNLLAGNGVDGNSQLSISLK